MSEVKEFKEIDLFVDVDEGRVKIGKLGDIGPGQQEVIRLHCAEVSIPYHTETEVYSFNCFLLHVPANVPAVFEMAYLSSRAHRLYNEFAKDAQRMR